VACERAPAVNWFWVLGHRRVADARQQRVMRHLFLSILLVSTPSGAVGPDDLDFVTASSLPSPVWAALRADSERLAPYMLSAHLNPYYLQGDFNGDAQVDTAILVNERATGKAGILLLHGPAGPGIVLGAGKSFGNGGDSFSWMDAWYVYPMSAVERGASEGVPPQLLGDALMLIKTESASGIAYWTGSEYAWYQQGD
jgi:hypothetical protein